MRVYRLVDVDGEVVSPMSWWLDFTDDLDHVERERCDLERKYGLLEIQVAYVGEWDYL